MDTTTKYDVAYDKAQSLMTLARAATVKANERGTKARCKIAGDSLMLASAAYTAAGHAAVQIDVKEAMHRLADDCNLRAQTMYARIK